MKQIQRLFASLLLVCALALNTSAGIIQTGNPPPPTPAPATATSTPAEEGGDEITDGGTAEGKTPVLEAATAIALDFLYGVLTIF